MELEFEQSKLKDKGTFFTVSLSSCLIKFSSVASSALVGELRRTNFCFVPPRHNPEDEKFNIYNHHYHHFCRRRYHHHHHHSRPHHRHHHHHHYHQVSANWIYEKLFFTAEFWKRMSKCKKYCTFAVCLDCLVYFYCLFVWTAFCSNIWYFNI